MLEKVKEDVEGSSESIEIVEFQGPTVSRPNVLNVGKRTLSEPNLSVIQHELELVRKGLWSPAVENNKDITVEQLSSHIISNLKKSQSELEEQFSRMIEIHQNSLEEVEEMSNIPGVDEEITYMDDSDPLYNIQKSTQTAVKLQEKLKNQNLLLKMLQNSLKNYQGIFKIYLFIFCEINMYM